MTTTPEQIASELDGLIDSLDEHVSHEDISRALGELRDSVRAGLLGGDPTEEQIEAVARELACLDKGDPWPTNAQLGGSLTGDRDMEYRSGMREQARDLLLVAARAAGIAPRAHAKDLSTSPGRMKNEADSFNVTPEEPSEYPYEDHLLSRAPQEASGGVSVPGYDGTSTGPTLMDAPQEPSECHDAEERVRAVSTGAPEVRLLACVECGVLLWDIDAHYGHAHPEAECDHPNHGNSDHDCAPFSSATEPAAPSPDREKLIAEAREALRRCKFDSGADHATIFNAFDALAVQPVLDHEKVAEVIEYYFDVPGDRLELITRALCEAAKRGELT